MNILLKYPTRGRPHLFKNTFSKYRDKLSHKHNYRFLISLDEDDKTMNCPEMINFLESQSKITYCFGANRSKVQAINSNMECAEDYDVLLLISDDMVPEVDGYDDVICTKMQEFYPDTLGVLHFNDGRAGSGLNTLSIMGRKMYEHFGYIYHPQYTSLWCDNEFHDVTIGMGKSTYIDQVIIKHAWVDLTGKDALNLHNEQYYKSDQFIYEMRKSKGFPKELIQGSDLQARELKKIQSKIRPHRRR